VKTRKRSAANDLILEFCGTKGDKGLQFHILIQQKERQKHRNTGRQKHRKTEKQKEIKK